LRPDFINWYKKVHHTHEPLSTNPEVWSLGEVQRFLSAAHQLTKEFAKFAPQLQSVVD
jgi:hypothetical protein